jgi:hypothetical protein
LKSNHTLSVAHTLRLSLLLLFNKRLEEAVEVLQRRWLEEIQESYERMGFNP